MGLLKAGIGALSGALGDSWRDYFYADAMDASTLAVKAEKRATRKFGSNRHGNTNIISNGSIVAVNEGQCMLIVDQGKVTELCAEPGEFVYDSSTEPSLFYGDLATAIGDTAKQVARRFAFGGDAPKDQRVYFINTKEIMGNKYGTPAPVPFRVVDNNIGLDVDISIRCHGEYSYRIVEPMLFFTNVCGNIEDSFDREELDSQLRAELMTALQPAFARISEQGIRYSALPGHTMELAGALNEVLSDKWTRLRGMMISSMAVASVTASEEDEKMIKELQRNATFRNPNMAAAHMVGAQAQAMQDAAKNAGGAFMGFAGMNAASATGGINAQQLFQMGQQQAAAAPQAAPRTAEAGWICSCGAQGNTGKFCAECGSPRPVSDEWICKCGAKNKGRFCQECGASRPAAVKHYRCSKCGFVPKDDTNPPKFCPECGDPFTEADAK